MKIWIINPFDNLPQEGFRPQRYCLMAQALRKRGHEVTIWTSDFNHGTKRRRGVETQDGLRLVKTFAYGKNVSVRRALSHWLLAREWKRMAEKEREKPEVIVVSMPPMNLAKAAAEFGKAHGIKTVVDVQDAWPETFSRVMPGWMVKWLKRTARKIYLGADAISAVARKYAELARGYGAKCEMKVTGHGKDLSIDRLTDLPIDRFDDSEARMCYVGNMGRSYDLRTVVEGVMEMEGVELDLAGEGEQLKELKNLAKGCGRIRFHGYLTERELQGMIERCNMGVVPMYKEAQVAVPGKLADYGEAGLKVVYSLEGEIEEFIGEAGRKYEAGNKESFKAAVREAAKLKRGLKREDFDAEKLMRDYAEWLEGICLQA